MEAGPDSTSTDYWEIVTRLLEANPDLPRTPNEFVGLPFVVNRINADDKDSINFARMDEIYRSLGLEGKRITGHQSVVAHLLFIAASCNYINRFLITIGGRYMWRRYNADEYRNIYDIVDSPKLVKNSSCSVKFMLPKVEYMHPVIRTLANHVHETRCSVSLDKTSFWALYTPMQLHREYGVYFAQYAPGASFCPKSPIPASLYVAMGDPVESPPRRPDDHQDFSAFVNTCPSFLIRPEMNEDGTGANDIAQWMLEFRNSESTDVFPKELRDILALVWHVFCSGHLGQYRQLLCWAAHLLKRPWEKSVVSPVLKGAPGTGKTQFVRMLGSILGKALFIEEAGVEGYLSQFNAIYENRMLCLLDEVDWKAAMRLLQRLKARGTSDRNTFEKKFQDSHTGIDLSRAVYITNLEAVPGEWEARRFMALLVSFLGLLNPDDVPTPKKRRAFGKHVYEAFTNERGIRMFAALLYAMPPRFLDEWAGGNGLDKEDFALLGQCETSRMLRDSPVYRWHHIAVTHKYASHNTPPVMNVVDPANPPAQPMWQSRPIRISQAYQWYLAYTDHPSIKAYANSDMPEADFVQELRRFLPLVEKKNRNTGQQELWVCFGETREEAAATLRNMSGANFRETVPVSMRLYDWRIVRKWMRERPEDSIDGNCIRVWVEPYDPNKDTPVEVDREHFQVDGPRVFLGLTRMVVPAPEDTDATVVYSSDPVAMCADICTWVPFATMTVEKLAQLAHIRLAIHYDAGPDVDSDSEGHMSDEDMYHVYGSQNALEFHDEEMSDD